MKISFSGRVTPALAGGARVARSAFCDEAIPFQDRGAEIASHPGPDPAGAGETARNDWLPPV